VVVVVVVVVANCVVVDVVAFVFVAVVVVRISLKKRCSIYSMCSNYVSRIRRTNNDDVCSCISLSLKAITRSPRHYRRIKLLCC